MRLVNDFKILFIGSIIHWNKPLKILQRRRDQNQSTMEGFREDFSSIPDKKKQ